MNPQQRIEIIKQELGAASGEELDAFAEVWCLDQIDSETGFRRKFAARIATIKNSGLVIVGAVSESPAFSVRDKEGKIVTWDNKRGNLLAVMLRNSKPT